MNIGDFARLGGISVRMLRHYDALGLLVPASVDPFTGYRRYDARQLERLNRILALPGVRHVETSIAVKTLKYDIRAARITRDWQAP